MENPTPNTINDSNRNLQAFPMENPFSFKVLQVFTGFGVGCGVGIGVGQPIDLGAIPALQQVMSATRGATHHFSGVRVHVNNSIRKLGMKGIEAGVGCGVGIGHGFGIGLAVKPGVVHRIQSSVAQVLTKLMVKMGVVPSLPSVENVIPGSVQSSISVLSGQSGRSMQSSIGSVLDLATKTRGDNFQAGRSVGTTHKEPTHIPYESKGYPSDKSFGTHTEKVLDDFLQNPLFKNEDVEVNELAGKLRSENNVLQVLLKHQEAIQELMDENRKLHQILLDDLKVPPNKLKASNESRTKSSYSSSDCSECRKRMQKATR